MRVNLNIVKDKLDCDPLLTPAEQQSVIGAELARYGYKFSKFAVVGNVETSMHYYLYTVEISE